MWGGNCPLCNKPIKPENMDRHIEQVHPRFIATADKIPVSDQICPICGTLKSASDNKYGLSICSRHYVSDVRKFLIKTFYVELKKKNDAILAEDPIATHRMINRQLHLINALWGWDLSKVTDTQHVIFNEACAFTGYLILRAIEAAPRAKEMFYSTANSDAPVRLQQSTESKINRILLLMHAEYELFVAIKLGASGYYDLAVDNEVTPRFVLIIPIQSGGVAQQILQLRLKDANEGWHGTFGRILFPYGTSSAHDENGASFRFDRTQIEGHFEYFREAWREVFQAETSMSSSEFGNFWDWLDWVISQDGITEDNMKKATYFEDFREFKLSKDLVFETMKTVLPEAETRLHLISFAELPKSDPYFSTFFKLADLARGFKVSSSLGRAYFFPCRKWFYGKLMPVFVKFVGRLGRKGELFEKDLTEISNFYAKSGIKIGELSTTGFMIEPRIEGAPKIKTSRSIPWRIVESHWPITLPEGDATKVIGRAGEIDLIVYANMSLYLIELKGISLEDRYAIKYMRDKAPNQCAKYSAWVRDQVEFEKFIHDHGINEKQLKSVRVVIASSGVFKDRAGYCKTTNESFAIVPESILFSTMGGLFTVSFKEVFPSRVAHIAPSLKINNDDVSYVKILDLDRHLGKLVSGELLLWAKLITLDRRHEFQQPKVEPSTAEAFGGLGPTFIVNEAYLEETASWILPKPLLIKEEEGYKFHLGTQIGDAGTTMVCDNCRSAIKYYWPQGEDEVSRRIGETLDSSLCPLCGKPAAKSEKSEEIRNLMTKIMSEFKYEAARDYG